MLCVDDDDCLVLGFSSCGRIDAYNSKTPIFTVPSDLCTADNVSLSEKECCENNNGIWNNDQLCTINGEVVDNLWTKEKTISFELVVNDGEHNSEVSSVEVTYSSYSEPPQPTLNATGTHLPNQDNGTINLFWDNVAEDAIDDLSLFADFQGYKIYRSDDYGKTWGDAALNNDGDTLGWYPYAIFDYTSSQDSTYCIYSPVSSDNGGNCPLSEERNTDISGSDPYQFWFNLGNNLGVNQCHSLGIAGAMGQSTTTIPTVGNTIGTQNLLNRNANGSKSPLKVLLY